jgi:hypothetical protein
MRDYSKSLDRMATVWVVALCMVTLILLFLSDVLTVDLVYQGF